jgi:hypothetical protein
MGGTMSSIQLYVKVSDGLFSIQKVILPNGVILTEDLGLLKKYKGCDLEVYRNGKKEEYLYTLTVIQKDEKKSAELGRDRYKICYEEKTPNSKAFKYVVDKNEGI